MTSLRLANVSVKLGGRKILEDVSFEVAPGEVVGLIGPNGAGKTSALKVALGLVPLGMGFVELGTGPISGLNPKERARKIAYVPQGAPVHWPMTAERTVSLGRIPHMNPWQDVNAGDTGIVRKAMEETDCWSLRDRLVTTLSGGERSRVLLARAIAVGAGFLLADEPTASLDPAHQLQVMDILKCHAATGVGAVVVLHDLGLAARTCDRLILLSQGKVLASGTPETVLTDENIRHAFGVRVVRWQEAGVPLLAPFERVDHE